MRASDRDRAERVRDCKALFAFYDFPAEHQKHIRPAKS